MRRGGGLKYGAFHVGSQGFQCKRGNPKTNFTDAVRGASLINMITAADGLSAYPLGGSLAAGSQGFQCERGNPKTNFTDAVTGASLINMIPAADGLSVYPLGGSLAAGSQGFQCERGNPKTNFTDAVMDASLIKHDNSSGPTDCLTAPHAPPVRLTALRRRPGGARRPRSQSRAAAAPTCARWPPRPARRARTRRRRRG